MAKGRRNSGLELFRIICLVFVFWIHGAESYVDNPVSDWLSVAVMVLGHIGADGFILISGYFGIRLDIKKMMHLDLMLIFYSWTSLVFEVLWGHDLGGEEFLSYVFPVIGKRFWYFTCFFALAFLSPFLNEMVEKMGRLRLRQLIATMLVIFSAITTFFFFDITSDGGKGIVNMVMFYLIGRYIGVYRRDKEYSTKRLAWIFAITALINFSLNIALNSVTGVVMHRFARDSTLFTVVESVCAFLIFRNLYFENKWVDRIAKHVPAALVFEWTLRTAIYDYVIDVTDYGTEWYYELLLFPLAVVLVVLGSVIDMVRVGLLSGVEEWIVRTVYGVGEKIWAKARSLGEKISCN